MTPDLHQRPLLMILSPKPVLIHRPHCGYRASACSEGRAIQYLATHLIQVHPPQGATA